MLGLKLNHVSKSGHRWSVGKYFSCGWISTTLKMSVWKNDLDSGKMQINVDYFLYNMICKPGCNSGWCVQNGIQLAYILFECADETDAETKWKHGPANELYLGSKYGLLRQWEDVLMSEKVRCANCLKTKHMDGNPAASVFLYKSRRYQANLNRLRYTCSFNYWDLKDSQLWHMPFSGMWIFLNPFSISGHMKPCEYGDISFECKIYHGTFFLIVLGYNIIYSIVWFNVNMFKYGEAYVISHFL